jgi:hypothetical protein
MNDKLEQELIDLIAQSDKLNEEIAERKQELIDKILKDSFKLEKFTFVEVKTRDYSECGHPEYNAMLAVFTNTASKLKTFKDKISKVEKYLNNITDKALYTDTKTNTVINLSAPKILETKYQLRKK